MTPLCVAAHRTTPETRSPNVCVRDTEVDMKMMQVITYALMLALASVFAGQAAALQSRDAFRVGNIHNVQLVGLDTNLCTVSIKDQLFQKGLLVTDQNKVADAVLEVEIDTDDSLQDHDEVEKAKYSAALVGM